MTDPVYDLAVIGGGAAGFFAALHAVERAAQQGGNLRVVILEKGARFLSKVLVSGGGRCNLTNAIEDPAELAKHYPRGGRELRAALHHFGSADTKTWFQSRGLKLKTEPDGRVFPVSDRAQSVIDLLMNEAARLKIELRDRTPVENIQQGQHGFVLGLRGQGVLNARTVLLATGGDAAAMKLAESLGHTIMPPAPSLFTFVVKDPRLTGLAGVSVPSARVSLEAWGLRSQGPLLVTHWGLSGPAVLRLSAWGARHLHQAGYQVELTVNWGIGEWDDVYAALKGLRSATPRRLAAAKVSEPVEWRVLPQRMWERLVEHAGIPLDQEWGGVSNAALQALADGLSRAHFAVSGKGEFKDEFVTCGGVSLKEIDFRTMHSRVCPGLYVAGEALDVDGLTGGFNFQNAWTTGWLAGEAIAVGLTSG